MDDQTIEEIELADKYDLVAVRSFIKDPKKARVRTKGAERQARFLEAKAQVGLVKEFVPVALIAQVKAAGSWDAWSALQAKAVSTAPVSVLPASLPGPVAQSVDLSVPGPVAIATPVVSEAEILGERVKSLGGAKGWLVRRLLAV